MFSDLLKYFLLLGESGSRFCLHKVQCLSIRFHPQDRPVSDMSAGVSVPTIRHEPRSCYYPQHRPVLYQADFAPKSAALIAVQQPAHASLRPPQDHIHRIFRWHRRNGIFFSGDRQVLLCSRRDKFSVWLSEEYRSAACR